MYYSDRLLAAGAVTAVGRAVFGRIDLRRVDCNPCLLTQRLKEARFEAVMTGGAVAALLHEQEQSIAVTVEADFPHFLVVTGFFTLTPEFFSTKALLSSL